MALGGRLGQQITDAPGETVPHLPVSLADLGGTHQTRWLSAPQAISGLIQGSHPRPRHNTLQAMQAILLTNVMAATFTARRVISPAGQARRV